MTRRTSTIGSAAIDTTVYAGLRSQEPDPEDYPPHLDHLTYSRPDYAAGTDADAAEFRGEAAQIAAGGYNRMADLRRTHGVG